MPKVSEFFGISIYMYFRDHAPPHFHARYGGAEALVRIEDLSVMEGSLPPRALGLVMEWASLHQKELAEAWSRAQAHEAPGKIDPLS